MNNFKTLAIISLISNALVFVFLFLNKPEPFDVKSLEKQNNQLQQKIDSLKIENEKVSSQIGSVAIRIDTLMSKDEEFKKLYDENNKKIDGLKKKISALDRVDTFNSNDIKSYFSNLPK
jgi:peptidoglycan hydrolase CwlO-like protein